MSFVQLTITFFLIMDAFGNMPVFIALLKNCSLKRQRLIIIREMCVALLIMLLFCLLGKELLQLLKVDESAVQLSGAIVLMCIGFQMLFPEHLSIYGSFSGGEPFIVPLAIPLTAGPSVIGALLFYASSGVSTFSLSLSLFVAWMATTLSLLVAPWISALLGRRILEVLEKIMGFIMLLLSVEMFVAGLKTYMR